jgi:hypothetical protein
MTEKEKAIQLVNNFLPYANDDYHDTKYQHELNETRRYNAKECALICVDKMIDEWTKEEHRLGKVSYWEQVKQEIENL